MVIKEGYKQTEIGLIPNDWEVQSIQYLTENIIDYRGVTPRKLGMDWGKGSIVALSAGNVKKGYIDFDSECYLGSEELYTRWMRNGDSKKDDIAFTLEAPLGNIALIPDNKKYILSQRTILLQINKSRYYPIYVFQYLISSSFQNYISATATGSTAQGIKRKTFETLTIAIPKTLTEQTAIATALSDADGLITGLEKLIAKKRNIKQGAMQQLLQPKEGWEVKKIIELSENKKELFDDGDWVESEHIINEGVRLIQTGNIGVGKYLEKGSKKYISENSFLELKCKPLIKGDILICRLADPAGRACIFPDINEQKVITSVDVTIFRPKNELVNRNFLLYTFSTSKWFQQIIEKVGGTTHKRISRSSLGNIKISLPALEDQTRIATILSDMDAELSALEQKLEKYKKVKLGMMQELLTGKTRLV